MIPYYSDSEDPRPLVYIDQNIIDSLRKNMYSFGEKVFSERLRAIYSDETLREIRRAEEGGGSADEYLKVLEQLDAYHLRLEFNSQFVPSGKAIIQFKSPIEVYNEFVQNKEFDDLVEANLLVSRKIMGGLPDLSVEEIAAKMLASFEGVTQSLEQNFQNLEPFILNSGEMLKQFFNSLGVMKAISVDDYKLVLSELVDILTNNMNLNDNSQSVLNQYREKLKLNPKNLNNLSPPRIVEQVWQFISMDEEIAKSDVTMNQFFGVDVQNPIYPDRRNFLSEQVSNVYFHLNLAGYYPDKGLHQQRKFASSFSDMQHVSLATHCNFLMSSDKRLIKKAAAAYEFVGAGTQTISLTITDAEGDG